MTSTQPNEDKTSSVISRTVTASRRDFNLAHPGESRSGHWAVFTFS